MGSGHDRTAPLHVDLFEIMIFIAMVGFTISRMVPVGKYSEFLNLLGISFESILMKIATKTI